MKKLFLVAVIMASCGLLAKEPKYIFLFIGDGMSTPQRMIAEEFSRKAGTGSLAMNAMPYQATTRTCSASSLVTDSAAAATAIACGVKTYNGALGVDAAGKRAVSCAEAAKKAGRKVGILSTVTITHATPGGFYAHRKNRGETYGIAIDLANSGFDLFAGGGLDTHVSKSEKHPEFAKCGEAYEYAKKRGYRIVTKRNEFLALKPGGGKILTKFKNGALETSIDRTDDINEPTLAELVSKAVELLEGPQGFFIMAEGGRIDWAGHANDAATNLRDVLALDEAVKVALGFLDRHPNETLVVVTGDHETGGLSMGFAATGYALYMDRLANQTMSVGNFEGKFSRRVNDGRIKTFDEAKELMTRAFGFKFEGDREKDPMVLSKEELADIRKAFDHDMEFYKAKVVENTKYDGERRYLLGGACRLVMSHKSGIGWSSGAHTAMPVLTTAKGVKADLFSGFIENTDISAKIKSLL